VSSERAAEWIGERPRRSSLRWWRLTRGSRRRHRRTPSQSLSTVSTGHTHRPTHGTNALIGTMTSKQASYYVV